MEDTNDLNLFAANEEVNGVTACKNRAHTAIAESMLSPHFRVFAQLQKHRINLSEVGLHLTATPLRKSVVSDVVDVLKRSF